MLVTGILTVVVLARFFLCITKVIVRLVFVDHFLDPGVHFQNVCVNSRTVEFGTAITPGHYSYLCGADSPGLNIEMYLERKI